MYTFIITYSICFPQFEMPQKGICFISIEKRPCKNKDFFLRNAYVHLLTRDDVQICIIQYDKSGKMNLKSVINTQFLEIFLQKHSLSKRRGSICIQSPCSICVQNLLPPDSNNCKIVRETLNWHTFVTLLVIKKWVGGWGRGISCSGPALAKPGLTINASLILKVRDFMVF